MVGPVNSHTSCWAGPVHGTGSPDMTCEQTPYTTRLGLPGRTAEKWPGVVEKGGWWKRGGLFGAAVLWQSHGVYEDY